MALLQKKNTGHWFNFDGPFSYKKSEIQTGILHKGFFFLKKKAVINRVPPQSFNHSPSTRYLSPLHTFSGKFIEASNLLSHIRLEEVIDRSTPVNNSLLTEVLRPISPY